MALDLAGKRIVVVCESIELDIDGLFNSLHSIKSFDCVDDAHKDIQECREALRSNVLGRYPSARESSPDPSSSQRDLHFCSSSNEVLCIEQMTFRLDQLDHFFAHSMFWDLLRLDTSEQVLDRLYVAYGRPREIEWYIVQLGADIS